MKILEMMRFSICRLTLLGALASVSGCAEVGNNTDVVTNSFSAPTSSPQIPDSAAASAQKIFAANSMSGNSATEDYHISPLDVLDISVLGVKDLNSTVQVSTTGVISLPLIRGVKAGGKTAAQLEQDIATKLSVTYLQSPQVTVFVKEYNSQRVTVDGAVIKPGIFPIVGKMSLLQSLALAEGLNRVADPTGIVIFRQVDNKKQAARFDLRLVRAGKIADPILIAGDIVMVDESVTRTTLRDVNDFLPFSGIFKFL